MQLSNIAFLKYRYILINKNGFFRKGVAYEQRTRKKHNSKVK